MRMIKAICIAFSTYSILPVPRFDWTEDTMRFSLCAFPLVGMLPGLGLWLWYHFCTAVNCGIMLFAALAAVLPLLLTGGIHMDGYCDTVDALSSHRDRERRLEILKDSHLGAFAVIYCAVYLLACYGLYTELANETALIIVGIGFVLSRSLAALSAIITPNARGTGMLMAFTQHAEKHLSLALLFTALAVCTAVMLRLYPLAGGCCIGLCFTWFFLYRHMAWKQFGGITGDTTGFFLQITELLILIGTGLAQLAARMVLG